jgi:hypothetical protein
MSTRELPLSLGPCGRDWSIDRCFEIDAVPGDDNQAISSSGKLSGIDRSLVTGGRRLEMMTGHAARRSIASSFSLILVLLLLVGSVGLLSRGVTAQPAVKTDLYQPVVPAIREEVRRATEGVLSSYWLDVRLDPVQSTIGGSLLIEFINPTPIALDEVALRLFPNAFYYQEGEMQIDSVRADGIPAEPVYASSDTAMFVPLPAPLPVGGQVDIEIEFVTTIPTNSVGSFGILNHDLGLGSWILSDWYPILTGWEEDRGWRVDPPTSLGDPTFSDATLYQVVIDAPEALSLVGTGTSTVDALDDGWQRWTFLGGPAREFSLVADENLRTVSAQLDDTEVLVHMNEDSPATGVSDFVLTSAVRALEAYEERYGPYPYVELDLIETELAGTIGVSWSEIIYLGSSSLLVPASASGGPLDVLDFTIVHEIGHQWFGNLVGVNSNDHTFMNEGLTNAVTILNIFDTQGPEIATDQFNRRIVAPYLAMLNEVGDAVVDVPISDDYPGRWGVALNYGKAALGFLAIRETVGDEAFTEALHRYVAEFGYRIATPMDLRLTLQATGGQPLARLWWFWFKDDATTLTDVIELAESVSSSFTASDRRAGVARLEMR